MNFTQNICFALKTVAKCDLPLSNHLRRSILLWFVAICGVPLPLDASHILGRITDSNSTKPLAYVSITILDGKLGTVTDRFGRYTLSVPPGSYIVEVNAIGYEVKRRQVRLMVDEVLRLDLALAVRPLVQETMVVTATGQLKSVSQTTVPMEIIDRETIELSNAENMGTLLEDVAGLNVHSSLYGYLGSPTGVMIQGIEPNRVLILVDGERVIGGPGGVIDLSKLPVTHVERIEVVKGPHSALYGSDAMGGVVHIITRTPQRPYIGDIRMRLGSGGLNLLQGEAGMQHPRLVAALVASRSNQEALDLSPEDPDTNIDEYDQRFFQGKVRFHNQSELSVRGSFRWLSENEIGISSQYFAPLKKSYTWRFPDHTQRVDLSIGAKWKPYEQGTFDVDLSRSHFNKNSVEELIGGRDHRDRFTDNILTKYRLSAVHIFRDIHVMTAGLEYAHEELEILLDRTKPLGKQIRTVEVPESHVGATDFYFQDDWQIGNSTNIVLGGRLQRHSRYGVNLAPKISLAYSAYWLTNQIRLRASYGKGYRTPSLKELHFIFDHSNLGYKVLGSPTLQPERSWGLNLGFEYRLAAKLGVRVNFFHNRLRDLIQTVFDPEQSTGALAIYAYDNIGRATTRGVEVGITNWHMGRLVLNAGYTYLQAREQNAQHDLPGRPRHALRLRAMLAAVQNGRLELRLRRDSPVWADFDARFRSPTGNEIDINYEQPLLRFLVFKCGVENVSNDRRSLEQPGDLRSLRGRAIRSELRLRF